MENTLFSLINPIKSAQKKFKLFATKITINKFQLMVVFIIHQPSDSSYFSLQKFLYILISFTFQYPVLFKPRRSMYPNFFSVDMILSI